MAVVQTSLIWLAYAVAVAFLLVVASVYVVLYQTPRDRAASVTVVCIFTTTALLATVLLLPVDVALVASTTSVRDGRKKDWATPDAVENMVYSLKIVYYTLYSLDAILCLLVVPFTYFCTTSMTSLRKRTAPRRWPPLLAAFKYTIVFIVLCVALFLVGFFVPYAKGSRGGRHMDLDYFKTSSGRTVGFYSALSTSRGMLIGQHSWRAGSHIRPRPPNHSRHLDYIVYTAAGLALLPVALIKTAPSISAPSFAENTASQLEQNRERQRQLELRNEGNEDGLEPRDRRELEFLVREERTLIRRERLAAEASGQGQSLLMRVWLKTEAIFRPVKLLGGLLLMVVSLLIWTSMLITGIDKAMNSICKAGCGYVLGHVNIFQPINWLLVTSSKAFPVDYVIFSCWSCSSSRPALSASPLLVFDSYGSCCSRFGKGTRARRRCSLRQSC